MTNKRAPVSLDDLELVAARAVALVRDGAAVGLGSLSLGTADTVLVAEGGAAVRVLTARREGH